MNSTKIPYTMKVALITGSTDGIGRASARLFAERGFSVVINGRDPERLASLQMEFERDGLSHLAVQADVTVEKDRRRLIEECLHKFGRLDVLINNAGGGGASGTQETSSLEHWDKCLSLNLTSANFLLQEARQALTESKGCVVNVASLAGRYRTLVAHPAYVAAKAGLIGLTRQLAFEFAPFEVRVNAVAPGLTLSPRVAHKFNLKSSEAQQKIIAQIPLRRAASPEEIASPIFFLASDEASYITGITLDINGGLYMN